MKYTADVRAMIALLQATLAGSSEGRAALGSVPEPVSKPENSSAEVGGAGRPSLEPANWHARYRAMLRGAMRKELARKAKRRRKAWQVAEAAREERRRGKTYGPPPEGEDVFRGFRAPEATSPEGKEK